MQGSGCPKCSNNAPLNNQIIDDFLKDKTFIRLSSYEGANNLMSFKCIIDDYIWQANPGSVMHNNSGCAKCYGNAKLSIEDIKITCLKNNIIINDEYISTMTKITVQCGIIECNYRWQTTIGHIRMGRGCPRCAGNAPLTTELLDEKLIGRNITRLAEVNGVKNIIPFQCMLCEYIWEASPDNILNSKTGCPKCSGNLRLTNDIIDQKIYGSSTKRLGNYINLFTNIEWQCLDCDNIWKAMPSNIIHRKSGCPRCVNKNEKIMYDMFDDHNIIYVSHQKLQKINISYPNFIVDAFIKNNIIIEYNGDQHYNPVCFGNCSIEEADANFIKQQQRDLELEKLCKNNNFLLIWIDGRKYTNDKLKQHMKETIIPLIRKYQDNGNNICVGTNTL